MATSARAEMVSSSPVRLRAALAAVLLGALCAAPAPAQSSSETFAEVVEKLNAEPPQRATEAKRSWKAICDAYIDMTAPPMPIGTAFNAGTIHPKMKDWDRVSAWAKANEGVGKALAAVRDSVDFAMPYGETKVDEKYRTKGLCVRVGVDGDLRHIDYGYIPAIDTVAAYSIAELYRRLEAGEAKEGFAVAVDLTRLLRQLCDRVMLVEKSHFFDLLCDVLSAQRDSMWHFRDKIPTEVLKNLSLKEYHFLAQRRERLEMPEGEKFVAEALLRQVFDLRGQADTEKFGEVFGHLQAIDKPLTRFGATKHWKRIAGVHGSLDSSMLKLTNIYDNWWLRWRMPQYDALLELPTELSRTNPIRYGAVIKSISDIQGLFEQRERLVAEICGAAIAAGISGYRKDAGVDPDDREKPYAVHMHKGSDFDPWDKGYGRMKSRFLGSQRKAVDTPSGRVWVEGMVVYAVGNDHEDGNFDHHTPDGSFGDMIVWPPMRALERDQGHRE